MKRQAISFTYALAAVLIALLILLSLTGGGVRFANAAASPYSSAIEDLRKDESFDVNAYPTTSGDYSLHVIQLAESEQGELLIYTYQPAARQDVRACTICIAREMDNSTGLGFKDYALEYLNSDDVFFKYRVKDFELKPDAIRYYNISNILRPFNSDIDPPLADGQLETEVPNKVAQFWTACTLNGSVTYTVQASEVVEITQKVVGYCTYDDGLDLGWGAMQGVTKAYFVAFDTDRPIDKLISADISFWAQKAKFYVCGNMAAHGHDYLYDMHEVESFVYGSDMDVGENTVYKPPLTINHTDKFSNEGGGNWIGRPANTYTWNRIRSTSDFISDNNNKDYVLTASGEQQLSDTKWVLNFYEAHDRYFYNNVWLSFIPGVTKIPGVADGEAQFEFAYDVMLLRLEFETNGERYNLGVVDNKQTGTMQFNDPVYKGGCAASWNWLNVLPWWAWLLIFPAGVIVAIVLVCLIVRLVTLPFRKLSAHRNRKRIEREVLREQEARDNAKTKHTKGSTGKKRAKRKGKRK